MPSWLNFNPSAVYLVDRQTKRVIWRLGRKAVGNGTFTPCHCGKIGFETAIDFIGHGTHYFDVDALDATGNIIGRTAQVTLS